MYVEGCISTYRKQWMAEDLMNPPSVILYLADSKGNKVGDIENIVHEDRLTEINHAGALLTYDVISNMTYVKAVKAAKTIKAGIKIGLQKFFVLMIQKIWIPKSIGQMKLLIAFQL
jgi:hypothetical protein